MVTQSSDLSMDIDLPPTKREEWKKWFVSTLHTEIEARLNRHDIRLASLRYPRYISGYEEDLVITSFVSCLPPTMYASGRIPTKLKGNKRCGTAEQMTCEVEPLDKRGQFILLYIRNQAAEECVLAAVEDNVKLASDHPFKNLVFGLQIKWVDDFMLRVIHFPVTFFCGAQVGNSPGHKLTIPNTATP